jgi:5-methylcytosine-specific restriction endonuclease McrA
MAKWNLRSRIMGKLREVSRWDPDAREALKRSRLSRGLYQCAMCERAFPEGMVRKDHIEPVVQLEGFNGDWNSVIARLFPGVAGYQILCIPCHHDKTQAENKERRKKAA